MTDIRDRTAAEKADAAERLQERDEALHDAWCHLDSATACLRDAEEHDLKMAVYNLRLRIGDRRGELKQRRSEEPARPDFLSGNH